MFTEAALVGGGLDTAKGVAEGALDAVQNIQGVSQAARVGRT